MSEAYKILLVEDEERLIEMYQDKFSQEEDLDLIGAISIKQGLELAKEEKPDLILLDILLPEENGISFLEKWKKDPQIKDIPVVALSNYEQEATVREAYRLGVKDYLVKTHFTPTTLVEKVRELLTEN